MKAPKKSCFGPEIWVYNMVVFYNYVYALGFFLSLDILCTRGHMYGNSVISIKYLELNFIPHGHHFVWKSSFLFTFFPRYCQQVLNETVRTAKLTPMAARLQEVEGKVDQHVIPKEVRTSLYHY